VAVENLPAAAQPLSAPFGWGLRLRVWRSSLVLDRRLAEGVAPSSSPELELRARQLRGPRSRRALSQGLIGTVEAAADPPGLWLSRRPVDVRGVSDAARSLRALARDLVGLGEPSVRGIAMVSLLLCEPGSPLYDCRASVTVHEMARRARAALRRGPLVMVG
jgi:hypothetical protein